MGQALKKPIDDLLLTALGVIGWGDLLFSLGLVLFSLFQYLSQDTMPNPEAGIGVALRVLGSVVGFVFVAGTLVQGIVVFLFCLTLQRILHHVSNQ